MSEAKPAGLRGVTMRNFKAFGVLLSILLAAAADGAHAQTKGAAEPPPVATAAPQQCPDDMTAYAGSDEVVTCICPAEQVGRGSVWGTDIYSGDSATCRAALHAGAIGRQGGTVTLRMLPGQARYPGTTRRGVESINFGAYRSSYRFETAAAQPQPAAPSAAAAAPTQCPDDMTAYDGSDEVLTCICPAEQVARGSVWGTDIYSGDSATCRAALHAGAIGRQGGTVTLRMLPGQARYPGTTRRGVESINFGAYRSSYRFETAAAQPQPAAPSAAAAPTQCPDDMTAYDGSDEVLTCICPAEQVARGSVWGTDIYSGDSATCRAALHAGAIGRQGGTVTLRMLPGQARYPGTTRRGVESINFGFYRSSYRFEGATQPQASAPAATEPTLCPDNMIAYEGSDETLTCLCPGEATLRGSVWGTDLYSGDSATCRAAVHAGVIPLTGGRVTLQMLPGQARYPGSTRRGVQSMSFGVYRASYRFSGGQAAQQGGAPVQAPVGETLRRTGQVQLYITFRTNSADLDLSAAAVLAQLREALAADPALRLGLIGHTDNRGSAAINIPLSYRRAEAVRQWLVASGIEAGRLSAVGRGQDEPIADNATEDGRSLNRRVQALRLQ